jgi:hypothetical protein
MSARKLRCRFDFSLWPDPIPATTLLKLPASAVCICKNGIEFLSKSSIPLWTELTLGLESFKAGKKFECGGVVVACVGDRRNGYLVSFLFTNLPPQSRAWLDSLTAP